MSDEKQQQQSGPPTPTRPSHMNQGNQAFRPDQEKRKNQNIGNQPDESEKHREGDARKAS